MDLSRYLKLASNEKRRNLLYTLKDLEEDTATYEEIKRALTDREIISEDETRNFELEMTHSHLPMLEDEGIIEHDRRSEQVRYYGDEYMEEILERIEELEKNTLL